jgi:heme-degrading monooxygenase HmoA
VIGRIWHGYTTEENADAYQRLLEDEVLPGIEDRAQGFDGVIVLRRHTGSSVEFITLTLWESLDAVKTLVGDDIERAYVPDDARKILDHFDERSVHYDVVMDAR